MSDYRLKQFVDRHLPKDKKEFSRDAVEILLKLLWEESDRARAADQREREREEKHGPMWI